MAREEYNEEYDEEFEEENTGVKDESEIRLFPI